MLVKNVTGLDPGARIHPQATLREAAEAMIVRGIDALPVIENDQLVGVIRLTDLLTAPIPARIAPHVPEDRDERQLLDTWAKMPVRNIMNDQVLSVSEDTSLMKAAALMVNNGKQRLLVLRSGNLVGMITCADVVRALLTLSTT